MDMKGVPWIIEGIETGGGLMSSDGWLMVRANGDAPAVATPYHHIASAFAHNVKPAVELEPAQDARVAKAVIGDRGDGGRLG